MQSVVTKPRNKLSGIRIPSEAQTFSAKRPIKWVLGFFRGGKTAGVQRSTFNSI